MTKNNPDEVWLPDSEDLELLRQDLALAINNDVSQIMPTRASVKREFFDLNEENLQELEKALTELEDKIGVTNTNVRALNQSEIDTLVEELLAVRKVNDILSSREDALKTFAKNVISGSQLYPDTNNGSLTSTKHKLKISKEIRGGKLSIDINLLRKKLTNNQFQSVTDMITTTVSRVTPDGKITQETTVTHEVNEKYLEQEMVRGNINSEDVYLSSVESKRTSAIYIRELEGY